MNNEISVVASFSMKIGLDSARPAHAGRPGVPAGDTIRGAADLGVPTVAASMLYRRGCFRQGLAPHSGRQEGLLVGPL